MNPYTMAFAIGYFYGRAYPTQVEPTMPVQDLYHRENQGFTDGLEAGRRDYREIDLPLEALAQSKAE